MSNECRNASSPSNQSAQRGLECRACGCCHFFTTHTEPLADGRIRRRKVCRHCGRKLITFEAPAATHQPPNRQI